MKEVAAKFVRVFGVFVITASLFSACSNKRTPSAIPMSYEDLNYFQVDCKIAVEQRTMLESMRQTRDEVALDRLTFWDRRGNINRQIDYNLFQLRYCP